LRESPILLVRGGRHVEADTEISVLDHGNEDVHLLAHRVPL